MSKDCRKGNEKIKKWILREQIKVDKKNVDWRENGRGELLNTIINRNKETNDTRTIGSIASFFYKYFIQDIE